MERMLKYSTVGGRYKRMTFDGFERELQPVAFDWVTVFARHWEETRENGLWLLIYGPTGTGKSHLAAAAWNHLRNTGIPACMVRVPDLLDAFRPSGGEDWERRERMRVVQTVDCLVLDDLGTQKTTDWVTEIIYRIVEHRSNEELPTIITTNTTLEDLEMLGASWPAIVSRITGQAELVPMVGKDYRTVIAERRGRDD